MSFRFSANFGDEKPNFRFDKGVPRSAHVEVLIDDEKIDRLSASRLLRAMADRLLECEWPPRQHCSFSNPLAAVAEPRSADAGSTSPDDS
jgi:hypothetical protein